MCVKRTREGVLLLYPFYNIYPVYFVFFCTVSLLRPALRRRLSTLRPSFVAIRERKPCFRKRLRHLSFPSIILSGTEERPVQATEERELGQELDESSQ